MKKVLVGGGILLLLVVSVVVVGAFWLRRSGLPRRSGEATVSGLGAAVEVRWDRWAVPHVRASSEADLAAAVGYLHANDRMTQMELGRRTVSGRLAEVFGSAALRADRYFRELRMRRSAENLLASLSPRSRLWLDAYSRGVNAWLEERGSDLPPGLRLLRIRPEPWEPVDSLCFVYMMANNLSFVQGRREDDRFIELQKLGLERARDLVGDPEMVIPEETLARATGAADPAMSGTAADPAMPPPAPGTGGGFSNHWALGSSRTTSGSPLLANDPHLGTQLPVIWYEVRLSAPELEVRGMTLPGLPIVVAGQNADLAWGFTNTMLDDHDVFLETLDDAGKNVRRGEEWVPIEFTEESIPVRGGDPETLRLRRTDRGPLLEGRRLPARSVSWTMYEAHDPLQPFLAMAEASTTAALLEGIRGYVGPAQNLLVAHRGGEILLTVLGRSPRRRTGDGRMAAPAWNPSYGWDGLRPYAENPLLVSPPEDFLVSANNDYLPADHPYPLSADFESPHRAERIRQIVQDERTWSPEEVAASQLDITSTFALELVALLDGPYEGDAAAALEALRGWDGKMELEGPSTLFALVNHFLMAAIFDDDKEAHELRWQLSNRERLLRVLRGEMNADWIDDATTAEIETRHEVVSGALARSWSWGVERWGENVDAWPYGDLHRLEMAHPLGQLPVVGGWWNRGPYPIAGSDTTVAAFGGGGFLFEDRLRVSFCPSLRTVMDAADPDRSLAVLPGGQSGHPADPHYDDQLELFLRGELRPIYWSGEAIEEATVSILTLNP